VQKLKYELQQLDYLVFDIVPEVDDVGLTPRAKRANEIISKYGTDNCIFISIHNNAAGIGDKWYNASGWEAWTTEGKDDSDRLAECLSEACVEVGIKLRSDKSDGDNDYESNFTVIQKTNCPAVLTENMFMDSKKDVEFLTSQEGIDKLINLHIIGIQKYFGQPISIIKG
jgi:N-acetylmuramoyl-L-alanine amidase